jgi:hypothetical protein
MVRLLPVVLLITAAGAWFGEVQDGGPFVARNWLPLLVVILLAALTLHRGGGHWAGSGWRLPLGTIGFALPAVGLSLYLHYAYSVNLNDLFTDSRRPMELFRYLPVYTLAAGSIGFAIGWIVGRNVR